MLMSYLASKNVKSSKEPWLVDVAVVVNFFSRPDYLKKQFDIVSQAKPARLYLIADGPREGVAGERERCQQCRNLVADIQWDCDVTRLYADKNMGLFKRYFSAMDYVFSREDRCIFMEDDVIPSISFFSFCKELLDRYENDTRIFHISGWNYMGVYEEPSTSYFFSGEAPLYAYAFWKRSYEEMKLDFVKDPYVVDRAMRLARLIKPGYEKRIKRTADNPMWEGHIPHVEFYKNLTRFTESQLGIIPAKNMVENIGLGGVHSVGEINKVPKGMQWVYYAKTYEIDFPMVHPKHVMRDLVYDAYANRKLAWNMPLIQAWRKCSSLARAIRYGDFERIASKFISLFKTDNWR